MHVAVFSWFWNHSAYFCVGWPLDALRRVGNLHALSKNLGCHYYPILRWFGRNVENQNMDTVWARTLPKPSSDWAAVPGHSAFGQGLTAYECYNWDFFNDLVGLMIFWESFCWFLIVLRDGCVFAPHPDSCAKLTRHQNCNRGCCFCSIMFCIVLPQWVLECLQGHSWCQIWNSLRGVSQPSSSATKLHSIDMTSVMEDRMWWFSTWPWEARSSLLWPSPCPLLSSLSSLETFMSGLSSSSRWGEGNGLRKPLSSFTFWPKSWADEGRSWQRVDGCRPFSVWRVDGTGDMLKSRKGERGPLILDSVFVEDGWIKPYFGFNIEQWFFRQWVCRNYQEALLAWTMKKLLIQAKRAALMPQIHQGWHWHGGPWMGRRSLS